MIILIFTITMSVGSGILLPDPDLIHTDLSFPLSFTVAGKVGGLGIYSSLRAIPVGDEIYNLDFYLLDLGVMSQTGIFNTKVGGGIGRIRRGIGSNFEKGYCYSFATSSGPRFPIDNFSITPALSFRLLSDREALTWTAGLYLEVGYEIP